MKTLRIAAIAALGTTFAFAWGWTPIVDDNFDAYTVNGTLNGKGGWVATNGDGGYAPTVYNSPTDLANRGKTVFLSVGTAQGGYSEMTINVGDLVPLYSKVEVSFDIYHNNSTRVSPQNVWWYWADEGEPGYGLQWDGGQTLPFGWATGASGAATVAPKTWANVTMEWDLANQTASSWYNGKQVDNNIPISGIKSLTAWTIGLQHDGASGTADSAYIDNFRIQGEPVPAVPEPATMTVLGLGAAFLAARRRK